jgi:hypothetical protein
MKTPHLKSFSLAKDTNPGRYASRIWKSLGTAHGWPSFHEDAYYELAPELGPIL